MLRAFVSRHGLLGIGRVDEQTIQRISPAGAGLGIAVLRVGPGTGVRRAASREDGASGAGTRNRLAGLLLGHVRFAVVAWIDRVRFSGHRYSLLSRRPVNHRAGQDRRDAATGGDAARWYRRQHYEPEQGEQR